MAAICTGRSLVVIAVVLQCIVLCVECVFPLEDANELREADVQVIASLRQISEDYSRTRYRAGGSSAPQHVIRDHYTQELTSLFTKDINQISPSDGQSLASRGTNSDSLLRGDSITERYPPRLLSDRQHALQSHYANGGEVVSSARTGLMARILPPTGGQRVSGDRTRQRGVHLVQSPGGQSKSSVEGHAGVKSDDYTRHQGVGSVYGKAVNRQHVSNSAGPLEIIRTRQLSNSYIGKPDGNQLNGRAHIKRRGVAVTYEDSSEHGAPAAGDVGEHGAPAAGDVGEHGVNDGPGGGESLRTSTWLPVFTGEERSGWVGSTARGSQQQHPQPDFDSQPPLHDPVPLTPPANHGNDATASTSNYPGASHYLGAIDAKKYHNENSAQNITNGTEVQDGKYFTLALVWRNLKVNKERLNDGDYVKGQSSTRARQRREANVSNETSLPDAWSSQEDDSVSIAPDDAMSDTNETDSHLHLRSGGSTGSRMGLVDYKGQRDGVQGGAEDDVVAAVPEPEPEPNLPAQMQLSEAVMGVTEGAVVGNQTADGNDSKSHGNSSHNSRTQTSHPKSNSSLIWYESDPPMIPLAEGTRARPNVEPEGHGDPQTEEEAEGGTQFGAAKEEAEPEADTDTDCGAECVWVEPGPDWETAKLAWQGAWEFHVYFTGILFAVIAAYSFFSIILLWKKRNLLSLSYFTSLNVMLFVAGLTRAVFLLVDAYNSTSRFPPAVAYFLHGTAFPCLTSAFSILFLALLQTTKMQSMSSKIQKRNVLIGIIVFHFLLSVVSDVVVGYFASSRVLLFVCEVAFVLWGLLLFLGYIYIFKKFFKAAVRRRRHMITLKKSTSTASFDKPRVRLVLDLATKVTLVTAILGLCCAGLHVYGMVSVYNVFDTIRPQPWPWWGVQFGLRLIEIGMCYTMSYVATQPFRFKMDAYSNDPQCMEALYFVPCLRFCGGEKEDDESNWSNIPRSSRPNPGQFETIEQIEQDIAIDSLEGVAGHQLDDRNQGEEITDEGQGGSDKRKRPLSQLVKEEGFIRFRREEESEGEPVISTDDELDFEANTRSQIRMARLLNGRVSNGRTAYVYPSSHLYENDSTHSCRYQSISVPNTGFNTPATPRSVGSTDFDGISEAFSFRPPSSIHLRESIDRALNYPNFTIRTPDILDTPDSVYSCSSGYHYSVAARRKRRFSANSFRSARSSLRNSSFSVSDFKSPYNPRSPLGNGGVLIRSKESSMSFSLANSAFDYTPLAENLDSPRRVKLYRSNSDSLANYEVNV